VSVPADRLNVRTARKAAIKRGTRKAAAKLRQTEQDYIDQASELYRQARADLEAAIRSYADSENTLRLQVLQDLRGQVNGRLRELENARNDLLNQGLAAGAETGTEPFRGTQAAAATSFTRIHDESVQFVHNLVGADGLQLSDRLWRVDRHARDLVGNAIERNIILGHSASVAAQDFLNRGEPVPADIQAKLGAAGADKVARAAGQALMTGEGNPYSNALRVFRTEINRAHNKAYESAAFEHPDVIGVRFTLSPNHIRPDICDMYASVNEYGLGPGVYPKGQSPYPAHPNDNCTIEVVFSDEVSSEDRKGKEDPLAWLKKQTPGVQQAVLGASKKRAALEKGLLRKSQITTPWRVLKQRYIRQGIDVENLVPTPAEPLGIDSGLVPKAYTVSGAQVSEALDIHIPKDVADRTLGAIDAVHGDGRLPMIPVRTTPARTNYYGAFWHTRAGDPLRIDITAGGNHQELTMAHEIGHFLDHSGTPGKGFNSIRHADFEDWRRAVDNSAEVAHLRAILSGGGSAEVPGGRIPVPTAYVDYLLTYEEIWARSYAQYIARKSGNKQMLDQLDMIRRQDSDAKLSLPRQWSEESFVNISREIDKLMVKLGWQKK